MAASAHTPLAASTPRVSIITPAFNAEPWLRQTIASVKAQSLGEWEMIIVDDASNDGTLNIARDAEREDPRIRVIEHAANAGQSAAQNTGLDEARAAYALLLDADDLLLDGALLRLTQALDEAPQAIAVYGTYQRLSADGESVSAAAPLWKDRRPSGAVWQEFLVRNFVGAAGCVLFRRSALRTTGPLNTDIVLGQDFEFWLRLALAGDFVPLADPPVLHYRIHDASVSRSDGRTPEHYLPLRRLLYTNREVRERVPADRLRRLERRFWASSYAGCGFEALRRRSWSSAVRYYASSIRRQPLKPTRWAYLGIAIGNLARDSLSSARKRSP